MSDKKCGRQQCCAGALVRSLRRKKSVDWACVLWLAPELVVLRPHFAEEIDYALLLRIEILELGTAPLVVCGVQVPRPMATLIVSPTRRVGG